MDGVMIRKFETVLLPFNSVRTFKSFPHTLLVRKSALMVRQANCYRP